MKKPKRKFNDDFYCKTVEEWENEEIPELLPIKRMEWFPTVALVGFVIGSAFARGDWSRWLAMFAGAYLVLKFLVFLEEINENLRFVRHQLRTYRDSFRAISAEVATYRDTSNFTVADFVDRVDREWLP